MPDVSLQTLSFAISYEPCNVVTSLLHTGKSQHLVTKLSLKPLIISCQLLKTLLSSKILLFQTLFYQTQQIHKN